jgi:hypothetical protein
LFVALTQPIFLIALLPIGIEIAALYFVFTSSASAWLVPKQAVQLEGGSVSQFSHSSPNEPAVVNQYWIKWVPAINKFFLIVVLFLMLAINPFILLTDSLGLGFETMIFFFGIMLLPTIIFVAFYYYEKSKLVPNYQYSSSKLDPWFLVLIFIRNTAFVASVIPFVQILGMAALIFGGIPYLIVYYFMVRSRNKSVVAV